MEAIRTAQGDWKWLDMTLDVNADRPNTPGKWIDLKQCGITHYITYCYEIVVFVNERQSKNESLEYPVAMCIYTQAGI